MSLGGTSSPGDGEEGTYTVPGLTRADTVFVFTWFTCVITLLWMVFGGGLMVALLIDHFGIPKPIFLVLWLGTTAMIPLAGFLIYRRFGDESRQHMQW